MPLRTPSALISCSTLLGLSCAALLSCGPRETERAPAKLEEPAKAARASARAPEVRPPVAAARPHEITSPHGVRVDEYYWLRDDEREDPKVLEYLKRENAYTDAVLAPLRGLEQRLFDEIVGRIKKDESTPPYRDRGYYYYTRFEPGKEYPIRARRAGSQDAPEQLVLDSNALAAGHEFFEVGDWAVSPDGRLVAWAEDTVGRRQYTVRFKDLETGEVLADAIPNCTASLAWYADNKTILYVEKDPVTLLGVRVKQHALGTPTSADRLVHEEPDHSFYLSVGETGDHEYVTLELSSTVSDELRFAPAADPAATFRVLSPRERDHEYEADHIDGRWIVRSNWQAQDFRLLAVADNDVPTAMRGGWRELVPHRPGTLLRGFDVFKGHLVLEERADALLRVRVAPWGKGGAPGEFFTIDSDEPAYAAELSINAEQDASWLRYSYTSLTTPETIYELHMDSRERRELKRQPVLGDFDPDNYVSERVWAPARDGARVPVSLVYRKGAKREGGAPLYQYAYGSYGSSVDPYFRAYSLSLLDRGVIYAIAHVRGGEELGRAWYEDGKLLRKRNTFNDFIDVTEHLVREGYAAPGKVAATGGSAGGLLMGAISNMRPELYRVIVADVPFV
ncbi:MAG: S9 family peptidase, partial [Myxococcales bacterium]|nr:S9 family peptidase [Myxococcales bacterium]